MIDSAFLASLNPAQQQKYRKFMTGHAAACVKNQQCADERLLALPHHRRIALHDLMAHEAELLEAVAPEVIAEAKRAGSTRHDIATTLRESYPLLARTVYLDRFDVLCDIALRLMVHYGRIRTFQTTDALEQMLMETDFGGDVPAKWFEPPFPEVFIEFGEHRRFPVTINDPQSGEHIIEGVYVMSGLSRSKSDGELVRGFDLIIFGSPLGKSAPLDDCFIHMGLPIEDEEKPIAEVVQNVVAFYASQDEFPNNHAFLRQRRQTKLHAEVAGGGDRSALESISWSDFEILTAEVFRRKGFHVERRGGNGADGGVDLQMWQGKDKYLVQCKQWKSTRVGVNVVRELFGVMSAEGAVGGFVVASGDFTKDAQKFAEGRSIELVSSDLMLRLVQQTLSDNEDAYESRGTPSCPSCGSEMVLRSATIGAMAGSQFWGCSRYPSCTGTRQAR